MLKNRLCYLAVLAGVTLFFFCFNGYLSFFTLAVALLLPFLSLLVSLPGALGARLSLSTDRPAARKGQAISLLLVIDSRSPFPSGRARVTLTVRNTLTGAVQKERFYFTAERKPITISHTLSSPACGQVVCELSRGRICDYMGLFSIPLRLPKPAKRAALFYPAVYRPALILEQLAIPDGEGDRYSQKKPGGDPSELFALREYREGDRLSQIHWKLSQKTGDTLVREFSLPIAGRLFFLVEANGPGEECDAILDVLATLSAFLLEREAPHCVGFGSKESAGLSIREITAPEDLLPLLNALLLNDSQGALPPDWEQSVPANVYHMLYLCCRPRRVVLETLRERNPGARLSVFQACGPEEGEKELPARIDLIQARPGSLPDALNGFRL